VQSVSDFSSGEDPNFDDDEEIDEDLAFSRDDWKKYGDWFEKEEDVDDEWDGDNSDDENNAAPPDDADAWLLHSGGTSVYVCVIFVAQSTCMVHCSILPRVDSILLCIGFFSHFLYFLDKNLSVIV
jgi:hypothetical protein